MKTLINIALIFLAIHLFTVNSKLLYHLNPDKEFITKNEIVKVTKDNGDIHEITETYQYDKDFSFFNIKDEFTLFALITALAYSIITIILIKVFEPNIKGYLLIITWFAILDGMGVLIYYMQPKDIYLLLGSIYYAIYTFSMIVCFGINKKSDIKQIDLQEKVNKLMLNGYKTKEISKKLNITLPKAYRLIYKNKKELKNG